MKCGKVLFNLMNENEKFLFNINGKNFFGINNIPKKYSEIIDKIIDNTEDNVDLDYVKIARDSFTLSDGSMINITIYTKSGRRVFCIDDRTLRNEEFWNRYKGDNNDFWYNQNKENIVILKKGISLEEHKKVAISMILVLILYIFRLLYLYYKDNPQEFQNLLDMFK